MNNSLLFYYVFSCVVSSALALDAPTLPPLHRATAENNITEIERILGTDLKAKRRLLATQDDLGRTPIFYAVTHHNALRILLREGASVHAISHYDGTTSLHASVFQEHERDEQNNSTPCSRMLIAAGANIRAQDRYGNTPLHAASMPVGIITSVLNYVRPQQAALLLRAGADMHMPNAAGRTPFQMAVQGDNGYLIAAYVDGGATLNEVIENCDDAIYPRQPFRVAQALRDVDRGRWIAAQPTFAAWARNVVDTRDTEIILARQEPAALLDNQNERQATEEALPSGYTREYEERVQHYVRLQERTQNLSGLLSKLP